MGMTTRRAGMADMDAMLRIEESAIPGYGYLYENRHFYFDGVENRGEMVLAELDGVPVGMGQYSVLPDGSGWLEILRVEKAHQRMGAGRAIYRRYLELAQETHAPSVAMFTGWKNVASRGLAEANGFHLAASMAGYDLALDGGCADGEVLSRFRVVRDPAVHAAVLSDMLDFVKTTPWAAAGLDFSPVRGPEGNIEFLLHLLPRERVEREVAPGDINDIITSAYDKFFKSPREGL